MLQHTNSHKQVLQTKSKNEVDIYYAFSGLFEKEQVFLNEISANFPDGVDSDYIGSGGCGGGVVGEEEGKEEDLL